MVSPQNPIVGGTTLRIPAIQSPNYVAGSTGWSINQDGTAEFNGLTLHGTLVLGTGSNNVIILDFARRAIFVYDSGGNLTDSISPTSGTDSFGNGYQSGITNYLGGTLTQYGQLGNGLVRLSSPNATNAGGGFLQEKDTLGAGTQSGLDIYSGSGSGNGCKIQVIGQDTGAINAPLIQSFMTGASNELVWAHAGIRKWMNPSGMAIEVWNALPFATNWGNTGAPWANGSYRRTDYATVQLGGVIQWNVAAANAPVQVTTALPAAYRPTSQHRLTITNMPNTVTTPTPAHLDIHTDGTIWTTSFPNGTGPMTPISLTGLEYPLDL